MKGLQGKKALVTGGGSGIGQAIAIRLGEEGVDVAINYEVARIDVLIMAAGRGGCPSGG